MELLQIQVTYQKEQDRLLLKFLFGDRSEHGETGKHENKQEIQAHVTRRFLQQLWPTCLQALATLVTLNKPQAAHASADIVQMEYEASLSQLREDGGFSVKYEEDAHNFPLGNAPLLIHAVHFNMQANQPITMQFVALEQGSFDVTLPENLIHAFCSMLQIAVQESDWGIDLTIPGSEHKTIPAHLLN